MVEINIREPLKDFLSKKVTLISEVAVKISNNHLNKVNDSFHSKYVVNKGELEILLDTIESKIRKCQLLHLAYFEKLEHSIIAGSVAALPFKTHAEFSFGTSVILQEFEVSDRIAYHELIDGNVSFPKKRTIQN